MVHFSTAMRYRLFLEKLNIAIVTIIFLDHRERLFFDYFAHFWTDYFVIIFQWTIIVARMTKGWRTVGKSRFPLEALFGSLFFFYGILLGLSQAPLGALLAALGALWALLGRSWAALGGLSGRFCGALGGSWAPRGPEEAPGRHPVGQNGAPKAFE